MITIEKYSKSWISFQPIKAKCSISHKKLLRRGNLFIIMIKLRQSRIIKLMVIQIIFINMKRHQIVILSLTILCLFTKTNTHLCPLKHYYEGSSCEMTGCAHDCITVYNPADNYYDFQCCGADQLNGTNQCNLCITTAAGCKVCPNTYYKNTERSCIKCPSQCSNCTNTTTCQSCNSPNLLQGTNCVSSCSIGTYQSGSSCLSCPTQCQDCTDSTTCQSCNSPFVLDGTSCVCPVGTYQSGGSCLSCPTQCQDCTDSTTCQSCNSPFVLDGTSCIPCSSGTYESQGSCLSCPLECSNCTSSIVCQFCSSSYYELSSSYCYDICGDMVVMNLPCDLQLGIEFDGCTDSCSIENGFVCKVQADKSICSYMKQLQLSLSNLQKIDSNKARASYKIDPPLNILNSIDISELFSFNVSSIQIQSISWNKEQGEIEMVFLFQNSIQGVPYELTFTPSKEIHKEFFKTPISTYESNFDFGKYFGGQEYSIDHEKIQLFQILMIICVGFGWFVWILGIFSDKLGGLETIILIQYAWISHIWNVKSATLAYASLAYLRFSSGYNYLFSQSQPKYEILLPRAYFSNLSIPHFYDNFNLIIVLYIVPLLFVIGFKISRRFVSKEKWDQTVEDYYEKSQQLLMYSVMTALQIFCSSSLIFFKFGDMNSTPSFILFSFVYALNLFVFIKFYLTSGSFGRFRFSFRKENIFFKHYFIFTFIIVSNVLLMGLLTSIIWVLIIPPGFLFLYTVIARPYIEKQDNIRAALTLLAMIYVPTFRFIAQSIDSSQQILTTLLSVLLALIYLIEIITFIQMIYLINLKRKIEKQKELMKKKQIEMLQLQQEKMKKQMRKYELNYFASYISGQNRTDMLKQLYGQGKKPNNLDYELHSMSLKSDQAEELEKDHETSKRQPFNLPKANIMAPFYKFWGIPLQNQASVQANDIRESIIEEEIKEQSREENKPVLEQTEKKQSVISERKKIKEMIKEERVFVGLQVAQKYKGVVDQSMLKVYHII